MPPLLMHLVTQPMTYTALMGGLAGLYVVWALAKRQFLGSRQLMNLLLISCTAGLVAGSLVQFAGHPDWLTTNWLSLIRIHPRPLELLAAYTAMGISAVVYIRKIRYPYWRVLDMAVLGLNVVEIGLAVGWLIYRPSLGSAVGLALLGLLGALSGLLYHRTKRHGLVVGVHLIGVFGVAAGLRWLIPSWQEGIAGVELLPDWIGILAGVAVLVLRLSRKSRQVVLHDIPRGVSQGFRDTFGRMLASRQPSSKDGSSRS